MAAYARGVNYFIETHRRTLAAGVYAAALRPAAVDAWSTVFLCGLQMYRNLTTTWRTELQKQAMLAGGRCRQGQFPVFFARRLRVSAWIERLGGFRQTHGQRQADSRERSASGIRNPFHLVSGASASAPGLDVIGVSLPGVPCVIIGHNQRIAWGVTNLGFDVQDLYLEKIDPHTGRYVFRGQVEQARLGSGVDSGEGRAARGIPPVGDAAWSGGVHRGRPLSGAALDGGGAGIVSVSVSGLEPRPQLAGVHGSATRGFQARGRISCMPTWTETSAITPPACCPIREEIRRRCSGGRQLRRFRMAGLYSVRRIAHVLQSAAGLDRHGQSESVSGKLSVSGARQLRSAISRTEIRGLLTARDGWKPEEMVTVQKDVYSAFSHFLAREIVAAYDRKKPSGAEIRDAVAALRNWNGQMEKQMAAPLVATLVFRADAQEDWRAASPGHAGLYELQMAPAMVEDILRNPQGWFRDKNETLMSALADAIADGRQLAGRRREALGLRKIQRAYHPASGGAQLPLLGTYFNIGPVEMSGSPTTIKQISEGLGPSMRFVADFSNWDESLNNITMGESGQILSGHYKDQWEAYYYGRSFPMQFQHVDVKSTLVVEAR